MQRPLDVVSEVIRVLELEGTAISACAQRLGQEPASLAVIKATTLLRSALDQGGKIVVTGVGKSGKIAQKIAATLSSTGSFAVFLHPTEGLHGDLGAVNSRDAVLALSHTGNTDELVRLLPSLKKLHVPIIGIGGNPLSKLAEQCDAWIDASIEQEACPHNLTPTTSTTLALAIGDSLAITLMQLRHFEAKDFAQNHPGGSLGRRLNLTVADIMHKGEAIPTVLASATMDEVVVASSKKKLGGVLVIDGSLLLGIITDGDIRRALQHRELFFGFRAEEVMTKTPVTAKPDMMASEALRLMENRPSQISVLPVVDDKNHWIGMIRLHDLARNF